jgi:hypothetical protein
MGKRQNANVSSRLNIGGYFIMQEKNGNLPAYANNP